MVRCDAESVFDFSPDELDYIESQLEYSSAAGGGPPSSFEADEADGPGGVDIDQLADAILEGMCRTEVAEAVAEAAMEAQREAASRALSAAEAERERLERAAVSS